MKIKHTLLLLAMFMACQMSFAQIDNEIRSYNDTTEQFVRNGKKMLLNKLRFNDLEKAAEIADYLSQLKVSSGYEAFNLSEDLYLSLILNDWSYFTQIAANFTKLVEQVSYPDILNISYELRQEARNRVQNIRAAADSATLDPEERSIVNMFLFLLESKKIDASWNEVLRAHRKAFPKGKYEDFIKGFLPNPYTHMGMSYSFGAASYLPTGNYAEVFNPGTGISMHWDYNVNRVYFTMNLSAYWPELKVDLTATDGLGNSTLYPTGEAFDMLDLGMGIGYFLVRNKRFHLAPYGFLGAGTMQSMRYEDEEDNDLELSFYDCFSPGFGLHTEFKLVDFKDNFGYLSLKLDAGMNFLTKKPEILDGSLLYAKMVLAIGLGEF